MEEVANVVTDPGAADSILQMGMNTGVLGIIAAVIGGIVFMFIRRKSNTGIKERKVTYKEGEAAANVALIDNNKKQEEVVATVKELDKQIEQKEQTTTEAISAVANEVIDLLNPNNTINTNATIDQLKNKDLWRSQ